MNNDITSQLSGDPKNRDLWSLWYEKMYRRITLHSRYYALRVNLSGAYSIEDAVHDALVKFMETFIEDAREFRTKVENDEDAERYLKFSARDNLLNTYRRESRQEALLKTYPLDASKALHDTENRAAQPNLEEIEEIASALKSLDKVEREILIGTLTGVPLADIAKAVGKSYSNVGVMRHRLRKKILAKSKK